MPIGAGYFAVAFSLGIIAAAAGLTPFQGFLTSALVNASAGENAAFIAIKDAVPYFEMAIIIPPAKKNRVVLGCVAVSFLASLAFTVAPFVSDLTAGTRTIILTVAISALAALLFPVSDEELSHEQGGDVDAA